MITASSVFAGFLFAALILVLEVGLALSDDASTHDRNSGLRRRMRLLAEIRANVAYTVVIAVIAAGFMGVADLITDPSAVSDQAAALGYPQWFVSISVVLLTHLFLTIVMVVKRLYMVLGSEADERQHRLSPQ